MVVERFCCKGLFVAGITWFTASSERILLICGKGLKVSGLVIGKGEAGNGQRSFYIF
jgi:hypothetical protein